MAAKTLQIFPPTSKGYETFTENDETVITVVSADEVHVVVTNVDRSVTTRKFYKCIFVTNETDEG